MFLYKKIKHLMFLYKQGGLNKIIDHIKENVIFDIMHSTNTSAWLPKTDFKTKPNNFQHGIRYRATATSEIRESLKKIKKLIDISKADYYDLGCGKGKTLCIAAIECDFNKVIGIDYYEPLLKTARKNIKKCKLKNTQIYLKDMTNFTDFSPISVIFLYNPATDIIINRIKDNIENNTEKAVLIYNKPIHENIFKDWKLISKKTSSDPDHDTSIYTYGID